MRAARAAPLAAALLFSISSGPGCGAPPQSPPPRRQETRPAWQDALDGVPDIYAVIRPRALRADRVYGSFWTSLVRVAEARHYVSGATMLEALEESEELVVALGKNADATLVLRRVPASLDPQRLVDGDGRPWFRPLDERTRVVEYEVLQPSFAGQGALFVLPDRTWVATLGRATNRARQAYATPLNRPPPRVDDDALAALHLGTPVVQLIRPPAFGDVFATASSVTFTLKPGKAGLVVALVYDEPLLTAKAEAGLRKALAELAKEERLAWMKDAAVRYEGNVVTARLSIPPRLLEELPRATGADLGL